MNFIKTTVLPSLPPIAIPTYQRSESISFKTLLFLRLLDYPTHLITLFVASEEEKAIYQRDVLSYLYGSIVVGVLGLMEQRNFITSYYQEGSVICYMDDDLEGFQLLDKMSNPLDIIRLGVQEVANGGLFSIMPNSDNRKLKSKITRHLTHCIGSFYICSNDRDIVLSTTEKEDMERSILYFKKYGFVSRFCGAGVKTSYTKNSGGLQQSGRNLRMQEGVDYILDSYPGFSRAVFKKSGRDLILNWRAKPLVTVPMEV
jgi:hypothetical protein